MQKSFLEVTKFQLALVRVPFLHSSVSFLSEPPFFLHRLQHSTKSRTGCRTITEY